VVHLDGVLGLVEGAAESQVEDAAAVDDVLVEGEPAGAATPVQAEGGQPRGGQLP
jgi:hypothetical protein